ncbi:uncharacterized protein CLUP02_11777 [Colletotrichum lupini]|uniref:Uncharacterized protein n=1 Tax=Colletotrichum lupini TaxID=145971 RepID=A0A9Q8SZB7_9PEZI|nr:uncharacterized protein CLUP02_11777 [Colletotrichum lupini]UQC86277.1 hypothetical protein CLUP02_11777 [Colletotrichum lupini]
MHKEPPHSGFENEGVGTRFKNTDVAKVVVQLYGEQAAVKPAFWYGVLDSHVVFLKIKSHFDIIKKRARTVTCSVITVGRRPIPAVLCCYVTNSTAHDTSNSLNLRDFQTENYHWAQLIFWLGPESGTLPFRRATHSGILEPSDEDSMEFFIWPTKSVILSDHGTRHRLHHNTREQKQSNLDPHSEELYSLAGAGIYGSLSSIAIRLIKCCKLLVLNIGNPEGSFSAENRAWRKRSSGWSNREVVIRGRPARMTDHKSDIMGRSSNFSGRVRQISVRVCNYLRSVAFGYVASFANEDIGSMSDNDFRFVSRVKLCIGKLRSSGGVVARQLRWQGLRPGKTPHSIGHSNAFIGENFPNYPSYHLHRKTTRVLGGCDIGSGISLLPSAEISLTISLAVILLSYGGFVAVGTGTKLSKEQPTITKTASSSDPFTSLIIFSSNREGFHLIDIRPKLLQNPHAVKPDPSIAIIPFTLQRTGGHLTDLNSQPNIKDGWIRLSNGLFLNARYEKTYSIRILSYDPLIVYVVEFVKPLFERSTVYNNGAQEIDMDRTSSTAYLADEGRIGQRHIRRASEIQGYANESLHKSLQLSRYGPGQLFSPHVDPPEDTTCDRCGTQFPNILLNWTLEDPSWCKFVECRDVVALSVKAVPGRLDPRTLYAGLAPENDIKTGLNI